MAVYTALLTLMIELWVRFTIRRTSHMAILQKKNICNIFFESLPYSLDENGYINYDELERMASIYKPRLIICGASAYPRDIDYERFRKIADLNNSYLLCDMSHISGLVATKEISSPFKYCDVVTTQHIKHLEDRSGMIFSKKELMPQIDFAVFPGLQGGPHNHQIAALCSQLHE